MEKFDNILSKRISEAFSGHNEACTEQDWAKMQSLLAGKKKQGFFIWSKISKAAVVLLIVGFTAFVTHQLTIRFYSANYAEKKGTVSDNENKFPVKPKNYEKLPVKDKTTESETLNNNSNHFALAEKNNKSNSTNLAEKILQKKESSVTRNDSLIKISQTTRKKIMPAFRTKITGLTIRIDTFSTQKVLKSIVSPDEFIASQNQQFDNSKKEKNKLHFSAGLSSFYNYGESKISGTANVGAGIGAEYRISKNIALNSGVFIAQNSLDNSFSGGLFSASKDYAEAPANNTSLDNSYQVGGEVNYAFISIDIPLNIYFYHNNVFFSGGFSSIAYFNETAQRTYNTVESETVYNPTTNAYETVNYYNTVTETTKPETDNTFKFGKMLNLSVGYIFKGKNKNKNNLVLEPYAKIPLDELTASNLRYGLTGISLRFKF